MGTGRNASVNERATTSPKAKVNVQSRARTLDFRHWTYACTLPDGRVSARVLPNTIRVPFRPS